MKKSDVKRIVQSGFAACNDLGQGVFQFNLVVRKRNVGREGERYVFIEIHHKELVARIAGTGKGHSSGDYNRTFGPHAPTVVNNQSDRNRYIVMAKILDLLQRSIFIDLKLLLVESPNQNVLLILNGRVQNHHIDIYADNIWDFMAVLRVRGNLAGS